MVAHTSSLPGRCRVGAVAVALTAACGPSDPPAEPAGDVPGFSVVQAWQDCAPWDGPAVSIVFSGLGSTGDVIVPPYLTVSLWKAPEELEGQTWRWAAAQDIGAASLCRSDQDCELATNGVVTVDRTAVDSLLTGSLRLEFGDRPAVEGTFRATWRQRMFLCGG